MTNIPTPKTELPRVFFGWCYICREYSMLDIRCRFANQTICRDCDQQLRGEMDEWQSDSLSKGIENG